MGFEDGALARLRRYRAEADISIGLVREAEDAARRFSERLFGGLERAAALGHEAGRFARVSAERGVAFCPLAAPTSTGERLRRVGELAAGFVYCVSVAGVTGVRDELPPGAVELLRRARREVEAPVVLGFGIGSVEAAVQAAKEADGIIIGSKLMRLVGEGGPEGAYRWLREVRGALSKVARVGG